MIQTILQWIPLHFAMQYKSDKIQNNSNRLGLSDMDPKHLYSSISGILEAPHSFNYLHNTTFFPPDVTHPPQLPSLLLNTRPS